MPDVKYYDLYDCQTEKETKYTMYHLGDATKEVIKSLTGESNSWYSGYTYIVTSSSSWVVRGCNFSSTLSSSIFNFFTTPGSAWNDASFRSVITAY